MRHLGKASPGECATCCRISRYSSITQAFNAASPSRQIRHLGTKGRPEIDILLAGPVHLTSLLVPAMLDRGQEATVVNVTSGGAYIPQPFAPVYSACKAALHSYTVTLRHALRDTNILVKELIPPAVATGLVSADAGHGASLDAFCDGVFPALIDRTTTQIGFGMTATEAFQATQHLYQDMFERFSSRFPVVIYAERLGRA